MSEVPKHGYLKVPKPKVPRYVADYLDHTGRTADIPTRVTNSRDLSDAQRTLGAEGREVDRLQEFTKLRCLAELVLRIRAAVHSIQKPGTSEL